MNKDLFLHAMLEPENHISGAPELNDLLREYPYFSTARILRLLILKKENPSDLDSEIRKHIPFVHNRKHLYNFINSDLAAEMTEKFTNRFNRVQDLMGEGDDDLLPEVPAPGNDQNAGVATTGKTKELLDFTYAGADREKKTDEPTGRENEADQVNREFEHLIGTTDHKPVQTSRQPEETPAGEDEREEQQKHPGKGFTDWIEKIERKKDPAEEGTQPGKLAENAGKTDDRDKNETKNDDVGNTPDLIDTFINGGHGPIRADKETSLAGDVSRKSVQENESFVTDSLAKIYIKQGLYSKAIYAYEKLSLKYPEKSIYFATQIEEIKHLINNK